MRQKRQVIVVIAIIIVVGGFFFFTHRGAAFNIGSGSYVLSPNGRQCLGIEYNKKTKALHLIDTRTMADRVLNLTQWTINLGWSPDSRTIYAASYSDQTKGETFCSVGDLGNGYEKVLCTLNNCQPLDLAFSPDGQHAAYFDNVNKQFDVCDLSTGHVTDLGSYPSNAMGVSWSADSKRVAAGVLDKKHNNAIAVLDLLGGKPHLIPLPAGSKPGKPSMTTAEFFALSPDGKTLAIESWHMRYLGDPAALGIISLVDVASGNQRDIDLPYSVAGTLIWSADSADFYYVGNYFEKHPRVEKLDIRTGAHTVAATPRGVIHVNLVGIGGGKLYYSTANDVLASRLTSLAL